MGTCHNAPGGWCDNPECITKGCVPEPLTSKQQPRDHRGIARDWASTCTDNDCWCWGDARHNPRPADERSAEARSNERRLQAYPMLSAFFEKYALGSKLPPSCFVCGDVVIDVGVQHLELLTVQCCKRCKDAADKARHAEPPPAIRSESVDFLQALFFDSFNVKMSRENCRSILVEALGQPETKTAVCSSFVAPFPESICDRCGHDQRAHETSPIQSNALKGNNRDA